MDKPKGYKAITDAPNLRENDALNCGNCQFFSLLADGDGMCTKYEFPTECDYVCDDYAAGIGTKPEPMPVEIVQEGMMSADMLVNYGGAVKSLNGSDEKDYAVIYGGEDLSADYFDKNTEFGFAGARTKRVPILFNHAQPLYTGKNKKYVETKTIGEAELEITEEGVLIR